MADSVEWHVFGMLQAAQGQIRCGRNIWCTLHGTTIGPNGWNGGTHVWRFGPFRSSGHGRVFAEGTGRPAGGLHKICLDTQSYR